MSAAPQIIVTGTGRCGTGFIAKLLTSAGVKCTHEGIFSLGGLDHGLGRLRERQIHPEWELQAESSWLASPFLAEIRAEPYPVTIVHLVRHPKKMLDSWLRWALYARGHYGPHHRWIEWVLPEMARWDGPVAKVACRYLRLNQAIEPYADVFHRIEDDPPILLDELKIDYQGKELFGNAQYNAHPGYGPSDVRLTDVPEPLRSELVVMSAQYGYEWPGAVLGSREVTGKANVGT